VGLHNASNLLTVSGLALSLGFEPADLQCFSTFMGVPGRLERIPTPGMNEAWKPGAGSGIFVDYAHTPDALIRVLDALRDAQFKRLITVFGCGGDRDRTKRPIMGEAVASRSDIAIVTSDNPRTEDPEAILDDVMPGLAKAKEAYREADRRKALELAVSLLRPGDALLVAGKGHEDYQIIGTTKHHFSDQEILKELISC
jgi:UDP-N-acetylmuramoyl-L-alanyl-D-glutamate--2,6-diaminopimelate ligase